MTDRVRDAAAGDAATARGRILAAAFSAFTVGGYADTSTLEIATRARVSKRELYALVGNKQQMLLACITERARRLRVLADVPAARDRDTLARVLTSFGERLLVEVSDPTVIAAFRLAIAEAERAPEVARALDSIGREAGRAALREVLGQALLSGLLDGDGDPAALAEQFTALLWGSLMLSLLLGVADAPGPDELASRARDAATAFLQLHPRALAAAKPPEPASTTRSRPQPLTPKAPRRRRASSREIVHEISK